MCVCHRGKRCAGDVAGGRGCGRNTDAYAYAPGTDPIYQSIPFFIALRHGRAYGLFFDNTHRTYFDMGRTAPHRYTFGAAGGELNYYVFMGGRERTPQKVLGDYTELTGRTPLPLLWSLGYQQSRRSYYPETKVLPREGDACGR
jgi:alpha-glucosidase